MAYSTGTASSVGDLIDKWFDFLLANGWSADVDFTTATPSPEFGIIKRQSGSPFDGTIDALNLYCGFGIANSGSNGDHMSMIPMRDYVSGPPQSAVEVATNSGDYKAVVGATHILTNFPSTPFDAYHFFAGDFYAHGVVEYTTGFYRHFGMGQLNKIGRWYGGEYYYGGFWNQSTSFIDGPGGNQHAVGLDQETALTSTAAVMYGARLDGTPLYTQLAGRQSPESKWYAFSDSGDAGGGVGNDADGRDRGGLFGNGPRGGFNFPIRNHGISSFQGYRALHPIFVMTSYTGSNPDENIPLGYQPDVRTISMQGDLQGGDEFNIGADTWKIFPVARKRANESADDTEQSRLWGLAYKKVT